MHVRQMEKLPQIQQRRRTSLLPQSDIPIPRPRAHICQEVGSIVKEYVPSFDFVLAQSSNNTPSNLSHFSSKTKAKRPDGWAAEYAKKKEAKGKSQNNKDATIVAVPEDERKNSIHADQVNRHLRASADIERPKHKQVEVSLKTLHRNRFCEYCLRFVVPGSDRVECLYCNVVAHLHCALPQSTTSACTPQAWVCNDCIFSIEENKRHQIIAAADHALAIARHTNAIAIQAKVRAHLDRSPFRKLRKGIVSIQGALRSFSSRKQFKENYAKIERPYVIKIHSATAIPDNDEYFCILSIVRVDEHPVLFSEKRETGNILYQFSTKCVRRDTLSKTIHFEAGSQFLIPATSCSVICYLTLVSKIPKKTIQNENLNCSFFYHGQARWDIELPLLYYQQVARSIPTTVSTSLGGLDHSSTYLELREKPGSQNLMQMYTHASASNESANRSHIKVELMPCHKASTHYGYLDEVSSVFSRNSIKRRWWCLLVEHTLYFYRAHHELAPTMTFHLSRSHIKIYPESGVLEIKGSDKTVHVSSSDAAARSEWFRMLKRNYDSLKIKSTDLNGADGVTAANVRTRFRRSSFSYEDLASVLRSPF